MGIISTVLLVLFVIVAIILIALVLIQDEGGDSIGGIFAGSSNSAFGSGTSNVVTRFTAILGAVLLGSALLLSFINNRGARKLDVPAVSATPSASTSVWFNETPAPSASGLPAESPSASASPATE